MVRKSSDLQAAKYRFAKKRPDLERSNPVGDARIIRSIPGTWVTVHSGDMGNTFG